MRSIGISSGEIIGASPRYVSCGILTSRIGPYTIKCIGTSRWAYLWPIDYYIRYGATLWGESGGLATIGVYMPFGWWEVPVMIFSKGGHGQLNWYGWADVDYLG